jgi:hypothetical protein
MTATIADLGYRARVAIPVSAIIVAVAAGVANAAIALGAVALGAPAASGLLPPAYLSLTVLAAIGGAFGWHLVIRSAPKPAAVMRWLVPSFLLISFIPDVIVGLGMGWLLAGALMLMHVVTITIAILTYHRLMPFPPAESAAGARADD